MHKVMGNIKIFEVCAKIASPMGKQHWTKVAMKATVLCKVTRTWTNASELT